MEQPFARQNTRLKAQERRQNTSQMPNWGSRSRSSQEKKERKFNQIGFSTYGNTLGQKFKPVESNLYKQGYQQPAYQNTYFQFNHFQYGSNYISNPYVNNYGTSYNQYYSNQQYNYLPYQSQPYQPQQYSYKPQTHLFQPYKPQSYQTYNYQPYVQIPQNPLSQAPIQNLIGQLTQSKLTYGSEKQQFVNQFSDILQTQTSKEIKEIFSIDIENINLENESSVSIINQLKKNQYKKISKNRTNNIVKSKLCDLREKVEQYQHSSSKTNGTLNLKQSSRLLSSCLKKSNLKFSCNVSEIYEKKSDKSVSFNSLNQISEIQCSKQQNVKMNNKISYSEYRKGLERQ